MQDMSKQEATRLVDALENSPLTAGLPHSHQAAALLRRWPDGEPFGWWRPSKAPNYYAPVFTEGKERPTKPNGEALEGWVPLYTAPPAESEPNLGMYKDAIKQVRGLQERIAALEAALEQARVAMKALRSVDAHSALTEDDADTINANLDAALRAIEEVRRG